MRQTNNQRQPLPRKVKAGRGAESEPTPMESERSPGMNLLDQLSPSAKHELARVLAQALWAQQEQEERLRLYRRLD